MDKPIIPVTRINKWFSQEDFDLEISMGRESLEGDQNMVVILFRVNREETESDDLYGEASKDGIRYYPPVELKVIPTIAIPENKAYNSNGSLRYLQDGQLSFGIYDAQLVELGTSISYGDYIGYAVSETDIRYYTVVNDGVKNVDNRHTIMGYKAAFRTVVCAISDAAEFNGI